MAKFNFAPAVNDTVRFNSNAQVSMGPTSGTVTAVDNVAGTCVIRYPAHVGDTFVIRTVDVLSGGAGAWVLV